LGGSQVLSVSTTSAIAILTATSLSEVAATAGPTELLIAAATLSLLVGVMQLAAGVLRLGFVANFISDPVLTGFKAGIAVLIIVDQLPKLLGLHITKEGFFPDLAALALSVPKASPAALCLGLATLILLVLLERFTPRAPAPLIAVVLGLAASAFFDFSGRGLETVGPIPAGLPALHMPDAALVHALWPAALGIALLSFTESIAAGRAFAARGAPAPDADKELLALGIANAAGGFTGAMASGGGASQTAVNAGAGAKSQIASLVTSCVIVTVLVALAPIMTLLPLAALAAVVVVTTLPLIAPREFRAIAALRRTELYWALAAFVGVVLFGSLNGILIAVAISVLTLVYHANHPAVYELARIPGSSAFRPVSADYPLDETLPGILILRTEGRIHFANARRVGDKMWPLIDAARPHTVILDCSAVPDIEYTALRMLTEAEQKLRTGSVMLCLAALNPEALRMIQSAALGRTLGADRMFFTIEEAVSASLRRARQLPGAPA
ncbi:MAG TPA: SulP family inorganic anion transporter, partial [Steroidobacteraceae bacterium]|nr:SulP family inorganic anion transporter [Steroidobacteraceae bacterium]